MSMHRTFFLAPSWDIDPREVTLGSIIANVKTPHKPLSSAALPDRIDPPLLPSKKENLFSGVAKKSREWSTGLFASFIQMIAMGGELSYSSKSAMKVEYSCESIETSSLTPSPTYIAEAVNDPGVKQYLKMGGFGARVFMVTGIKTASHAVITMTEEEGKEATVQVDMEVPGVKTTVGPKLSHKTSDYRQCTRTIEGPIVFAFQLEKVRVNRKGEASHKGYVAGAMLGREEGDEDEWTIEVAGQSLEEDEIEDLDVEIWSGIDEVNGEKCEIIVP